MKKEVIVNAKKLDTKYFHIEAKVASSANRRITGFASTRFPDRVNDIVAPNALAASMEHYMKNPVVLLDHDHSQPIGKVIDWKVNGDGLFVTCDILTGTDDADEAWAQIEFGARRAFSIGFIPRVIDFTAEFPTITELELLEISVVTIPANRESLFSIAKALELGSDLIERKAPKIGWEKTKAQILDVQGVLKANFKGLPTNEKIFVESFVNELHNVVKAEEIEGKLSEEIEAAELELQILASEQELLALQ